MVALGRFVLRYVRWGILDPPIRLMVEPEEPRPMPVSSVPPNPSIKAAFLAWFIPGLGHIYQKRYGKGVLYFVCIVGLFVWGAILGEGKIVYWRWVNPMSRPDDFRLTYICQFFVGLPALPALIQGTLRYLDLSPIFWGFMDVPSQNVINGMYARLGKVVDISVLYTQLAGLANVFAICDAYAGPAAASAGASKPATAAVAKEAKA